MQQKKRNEIADSKLKKIQEAYDHAIEKHPVFDEGKGLYHGVSTLVEEVGEVAMALNDGNRDHAVDELYQVIAVCLRFVDYLDKITSRN